MNGLADAVKNGPRATTARVAYLQTTIKTDMEEVPAARDMAAYHRTRANGDGLKAKWHRHQARFWDREAMKILRHAAKARSELSKILKGQAKFEAQHAGRVAGSTRDEFGTGPTSGGQRPGQVANPGPPPKPGGGQAANRPQEIPASKSSPTQPTQPTQPKGHPMTSGEAVDIEQTRANLDQLKAKVTDLRSSFEGMSGSLASGGLNKLAGSLATADDALESVTGQIQAAESQLADQEAIADAAQAAGEMHTSPSFYGAATGAGAGPSAFPRTTNLRTIT